MSRFKLFIYILLFFFVLQLRPVFSQEVKEAQNRKCLQAEQKGGRTATPPNPVEINVMGMGFPNNTDIEIEFCQPSDKKTQCTVIGKTKSQMGKVNFNFSMNGLEGHVPYSIYGTWPFKQIAMGGAAGDQQGTFTFLDQGNCVSITWDPYGRVFDAQSLEPIPNIKVELLNSLNPEKLSQVRDNPQVVGRDGAFSFLTKPGTYYLKPINLPSIYSFTDKPKLNSNYAKAYSKRDGSSSLYKPNMAIIEKAGVPEHRDIPLDPGSNPPSRFPIVNIPGYYNQMVFGEMTEYGGRISHPLSIVVLIGKKSAQEVARTTADKFGLWRIVLSNGKIPENEALIIKLIKVDLTTGKFDEKKAVVTNDVVFEPIHRNLLGYLYDNNGKKLTNTKVSIVLDGNQKTFYQTKTDEAGLLNVSTNYLPVLPYHLVYNSTDETSISLLPSTFALKNKEYLETSKNNLMSTKGIKLVNRAGKAVNKAITFREDLNNKNMKLKNQSKQSLFFAVAICILAVVIAVVILYFNSKNKPSFRRSGKTR